MKDHFIVGLLIQWLIIIHSSSISINVIRLMSCIIISSSSSSHWFHPYHYIVNLVMITSYHSTNSRILQSWHYTKSHHHYLQAALSTSSSGLLTAVAPFSRYLAIVPSLVQVNSKEGQGFVDLIPYISVHELVILGRDVLYAW